MFSINQNHQESVSLDRGPNGFGSLALIKITKSPYHDLSDVTLTSRLALIKITKSPYLARQSLPQPMRLALIKITKSPYP